MSTPQTNGKPQLRSIVRVYPVPERTVRDPNGGGVVERSRRVTWSAYWAQLLRDGDISLAAPAGETTPADAPASKKTKSTDGSK